MRLSAYLFHLPLLIYDDTESDRVRKCFHYLGAMFHNEQCIELIEHDVKLEGYKKDMNSVDITPRSICKMPPAEALDKPPC